MAKQKACKKCKLVYKGAKCPKCGSDETSDTFKGKVFVLNPKESEVAKKLKLNEKGEYAIRL
ncbi:MAG: transcription elongation factor subunit Spt4 [Nanoarchaeota archaeon]